VVDLSEDNFFSLIGDDCGTRDDLKLTENCTPTSAEAVRELLKTAEANGERVVVRVFVHLLCNIFSLTFVSHKIHYFVLCVGVWCW